jgi:hypothetical protein
VALVALWGMGKRTKNNDGVPQTTTITVPITLHGLGDAAENLVSKVGQATK